MKKNTMKLYLLAVVLGGSVTAFAQGTPARVNVQGTNAKGLIELSRKFKIEYEKEYAEASRLAAINNWPLVIKGENGKVSVLTKLSEEGTPLYTTTSNVGSAITSRANHLQPGGSLGLNLTGKFSNGELMTVGVWDGGYPLINHKDLEERTFPYDDGNSSVSSHHPTHVTATIIGNGGNTPKAKGLAPEAEAMSYDFQFDLSEIPEFAENHILSNHSYGLDPAFVPASLKGSYDNFSRAFDEITFDAPYYQPVVAAGNSGDGTYDKLTDRGVSKNAIVVAAVREVLNYEEAYDVEIAGFSSWGPTNDNRIKPDISAKGVQVLSATNASVSAHAEDNGTSMATPGVTGALLLLQQYYAVLHPRTDGARNFMRSSTVRALIAHTADEAGDADGPDPQYGWGLLNAKRAAELLAADVTGAGANVKESVLMEGEIFTQQVIASGAEPLVATLAWTDPPSFVTLDSAKPVLINDLDITIKKDGVVYYPWRLDGGGAIASGRFAEKGVNNVDNIEKVEINNAVGVYTITVSHKKPTLQNPNGNPEQAYSLLISGIVGGTAGLEDLNKVSMFSLWPNPAQDELNVSFVSGLEKDASVAIYDVQGRLVLSAALTAVDNVINVQSLVKGIYMVTLTNGDKSEVKKVIIK